MEQDIKKLKGSIEAILFAYGEAVETSQLAMAIGHDVGTTQRVVHQLMDEYEEEQRGIRIVELDGAYQLCTKQEYFEVLSKLVNLPKKHVLTEVQLETLSIIAYKQPITRAEIESIRGVSCVHAVNKLLEYHLIEEVGRLDALGRPILFGTTQDFLRSFGVSSTQDLPMITPGQRADFERQAEEEASITFDT